MDVPESIVVKAVFNEEYFGEPGLVRAIVEGALPHIVNTDGREIMFIHRKDSSASTSIAIEVHATGSAYAADLMAYIVETLMELPKLTYTVDFTETDEASAQLIDPHVAMLEAGKAHARRGTLFNKEVEADIAATRARQDFEDRLLDNLEGLPMPWTLDPDGPEFAELQLKVDMMMSGAPRYFNM